MNIQFNHKGNTVSARVVAQYSQGEDGIFILPDRNLGELGWAIFLVNHNNKWVPHPYLEEKYPDTFSNLLSELYQSGFSQFKNN